MLEFTNVDLLRGFMLTLKKTKVLPLVKHSAVYFNSLEYILRARLKGAMNKRRKWKNGNVIPVEKLCGRKKKGKELEIYLI